MTNDFSQTPKKSSNSRIFLIIGGIFVGLCCIGALCVGGTFYAAFSAISSSEVYVDALSIAVSDSEVVETLGSPITPGLVPSGSFNVEGNSGDASFNVALDGSIQSGTLYVVATKSGNTWNYSEFYVEAADGTRIELEQ
jgi:hypothetical protein